MVLWLSKSTLPLKPATVALKNATLCFPGGDQKIDGNKSSGATKITNQGEKTVLNEPLGAWCFPET